MFTGLVQAIGEVVGAGRSAAGGLRLEVRSPGWSPNKGDSISVAGVCLTVAGEVQGGVMPFDAVPETLARTTLGTLAIGSKANLERSLAVGDLMGGHSVQGHVEGVGAVERVQTGADYRVMIRPPPDLMACIIPKGSIAIDGVSLTIAGVGPGWFDVALIPTTLEGTTLADLRAGSRCNIETDMIARAVAHYARHFMTMGGAGGAGR